MDVCQKTRHASQCLSPLSAHRVEPVPKWSCNINASYSHALYGTTYWDRDGERKTSPLVYGVTLHCVSEPTPEVSRQHEWTNRSFESYHVSYIHTSLRKLTTLRIQYNQLSTRRFATVQFCIQLFEYTIIPFPPVDDHSRVFILFL